MQLPYTDHYSEAVAIAGEVIGVALTAVVWSRSFSTRIATATFTGAIAIAALLPAAIPELGLISKDLTVLPILQVSASLATLAIFLGQRLNWFRALAVLGQVGLAALANYVRQSDNELAFLHLFWYGVLVGVHLMWAAPPRTHEYEPDEGPARPSFVVQEVIIFALTVGLAFLITNLVFDRFVYNGDEVANSFQANVYGHLRAYAPLPPCAPMFENYWVFRHEGRVFSQYTPGWPLFMAIFSRLGVISLAGPVMSGIAAVGIARLSRRLAAGLGSTPQASRRIVSIASVLGPLLAFLGPAMLLNGASRFSHTMVCACFAWSIEALCVLSDPDKSRARAWFGGIGLGSATSLMLATRPTDGATLGVGIFIYFAWAAFRRRIGWRGWAGTALGFAAFGGLSLVLLRLQLGEWFQTGYKLTPLIRPGNEFVMSWPKPNELKYGIPLATGAYCWWPATPALGIAGLVRALGGRERRVAFMLAVGALALFGFYYFVEFGRGADDGLGPRYTLPVVVPMATGGAALLAPLFARLSLPRMSAPANWFRSLLAPAALSAAIAYGVICVAPLLYPVAYHDYYAQTETFRAVRKKGLKNAIVIIIEGQTNLTESNMVQNPPLDANPDVLYLSRHSKAEEACAREHYPGRTWYRAGKGQVLTPY